METIPKCPHCGRPIYLLALPDGSGSFNSYVSALLECLESLLKDLGLNKSHIVSLRRTTRNLRRTGARG